MARTFALRFGLLTNYLGISPMTMSTKKSVEIIKENSILTKKAILELKADFHYLTAHFVKSKEQQLKDENVKLAAEVEEAKNVLIQLEKKNDVEQISIGKLTDDTENRETPKLAKNNAAIKAATECDASNFKKEKKIKGDSKKPAPIEEPISIGRLDLRVAKVEDVRQHPDADSLYILKVNCGDETLRTVCSGLVKFVPMAELVNRDVILLCNLKPVKMRGVTSEAMVMCASSSEVVEVLQPPRGCKAGNLVECDGYVRNPDSIMNPKKKIFETVALDLSTNEMLQACYKNKLLIVKDKGAIVAKTLKNCQIK